MTNATSERLKRNINKIMALWEARANEEVVAVFHLESLALRNHLLEYLAQLADALSTTIDRTQARVRADIKDSIRVGKMHGRERASSANYTMDQLISDYHILRQMIWDVMGDEAPLIQRQSADFVTLAVHNEGKPIPKDEQAVLFSSSVEPSWPKANWAGELVSRS